MGVNAYESTYRTVDGYIKKVSEWGTMSTENTNNVASVVRTIHPEEAKRMLETLSYERQRNRNEEHVQRLMYAIAKGTFPQGTPIRVWQVGDEEYITDGIHRLTAVSRVGISVVFTQTTLIGKSMQEVHDDYAATDIGMKRSDHALFKALGLMDQLDVNESVAKSAAAAVKVLMAGFSFRTTPKGPMYGDKQKIMENCLLWKNEIRASNETLKHTPGMNSKYIYRQAPFAVMLVTMKYCPEDAPIFWRSTAEQEMLRRDDPSYTLLQYLRASSTGTGDKGYKRMQDLNEQARAVSFCWNAYFQKETLKNTRTYQVSEGRPPEILGTPYRNDKFRMVEATRNERGELVEKITFKEWER